MIRVVIADDHHLVRQGIRALLDMQADIEVIGEAKDGPEALAMIEELLPDVVVLDINMPHLGGIEVSKEVHEKGLSSQILILSMYSDESLIRRAFRFGAKGYLLKRSVTEELLEAIRETSIGKIYLSPEIAKEFEIDSLNFGKSKGQLKSSPTLTSRELEILMLIAEGYTNYAISVQLGISAKTVEKHRAKLMKKMGAKDLAGLIRAGIKQRLIFLDR